MEQMRAQKQDILAKEKKRQRQERTKRLIEIGALTEKYFDMKDILPQDYEKFLQTLYSTPKSPEFIEYIKRQASGEIANEGRTDTTNNNGANPKS